jgi:hypothetical protein
MVGTKTPMVKKKTKMVGKKETELKTTKKMVSLIKR